MMDENSVHIFLEKLGLLALKQVATQPLTPDVLLRQTTAQLGEIAQALDRDRYSVAIAGCLDLAFQAMRLWAMLQGQPRRVEKKEG